MKNNIDNTISNIKDKLEEFDPDHKLIVFDDGITLDSCYVNSRGDELDNIEIYTICDTDGVLFGETNYGCIDLEDQIEDEDDWYTIEDVINDLV